MLGNRLGMMAAAVLMGIAGSAERLGIASEPRIDTRTGKPPKGKRYKAPPADHEGHKARAEEKRARKAAKRRG